MIRILNGTLDLTGYVKQKGEKVSLYFLYLAERANISLSSTELVQAEV